MVSSLDPVLIAPLPGARRLWAIGAVHGRSALLARLHGGIADRWQRGDRLVYLGNLMGYGPDVPGTLDEVLRFRREIMCQPGVEPWDIILLRGCQEEIWAKVLRLQLAPDPLVVLDWLRGRGIEATLAGYGTGLADGIRAARDGALSLTRWTGSLRRAMQARAGHYPILQHLKRAAVTDGMGILMVSAGLEPNQLPADQGDHFWWNTVGFEKLDQPYGPFARVVRGFAGDGARHIADGYRLCLDGGAGADGGILAACLAPDGVILDGLEVRETPVEDPADILAPDEIQPVKRPVAASA